MNMIGKWTFAFLALALGAAAVPANAQQASGFDRITFVKAVRDKDGGKVRELLDKYGKIILNARDERGDTALTLAVGRRDDWMYYFLREGADPNQPGAGGDTPLIVAARIGFLPGAEQLLARKARVDAENDRGETALIAAVLAQKLPMVRLLLEHGADPDIADNAAGLSAREYAKRNTRTPEMLAAIESTQEKAETAKPASDSLDDFSL